MLSFVRKHADSWMIKTILWLVVLAFLATIFYSWGMGGASGSQGGVLATVNGTKIRFREYERSFNNLVQFYRNQLGDQFSQEMIEKLNLKTAALDGLIHKQLLLQQAEKNDIRVSDQELVDRIKSLPNFHKNNQFDRSVYSNFLQFRRLTPKEFEDGQREALLLDKMEQLIKNQEKVTESEIMEAFKREENKVKLDYIALIENHFKSSDPVTEGEKKQYYEKNKFKYQIPEQIRVQYVKIDTSTLQEQITPRDEDIEDYYKAQIGKFYIEEHFKASHILFQVNTEDFELIADDKEREKKQKEAEEETQKKANNILRQIRDSADFADMAKKHSDDKTSGANGGDLGRFPRGTMVSDFEKILLKLKTGETSEPVKTPFGYHLIRLNGREGARTLPLEEVKDQVIQSIKEIKARQRVHRIAKHIFKSAQGNNDLARTAKKKSIKTKTTDFISRKNHSIADIGIVPEFFNTAFELKDQQISEPVHTAEASYLLKVVERKAPYIPDLTQVDKMVNEAIRKNKDKKLTEENVKVLAAQIDGNQSLNEVAKSLKMEVRTTPLFSAMDSIPGIGNIQSLKNRAFSLKTGQTAWVKGPRRYFLVQLTEIQPANKPNTDQEKTFYNRLQQQKGNATFNSWLRNLQKKSEILIDRTLL